jgi:polyisoprenoid-binding protein YceI
VSTYTLGPDDGTLSVRTGRTGTVAKAGHDLLIEVKAWTATLDLEAPRVTLDADATSLDVVEGTGGVKALTDDDRASIRRTIDDKILKRGNITFRSTAAQLTDGGLAVRGELTLAGTTRPIAFELGLSEGRVTGTAVVAQTGWGIKPYSALLGALKVADDVRVEIDAALPPS